MGHLPLSGEERTIRVGVPVSNAMRSSFQCVWVFLLLVAPLPRADAFLIQFFLFRILSNIVYNGACQSALTSLGGFDVCTCEVSNRRGTRKGEFQCTIGLAQCLVESNLFCIKGDYTGEIDFGVLPLVGLSSNVEGCYKFDSGPPPELSDFGAFNELCIALDPARSSVSTCDVTIGGEECATCNVCDGGRGITFSCANVDIGGSYPAFVAGPEVTRCIRPSLANA